jgi:hypothetical protein
MRCTTGPSSAAEPAGVARIKLNMAGGQSWRVFGLWIAGKSMAPEDGMYRIFVLIDGEIPGQEVAAIPFRYANKWRLITGKDKTETICTSRPPKANSRSGLP